MTEHSRQLARGKKTQSIEVRVTPETKAALRAEAETKGQTVSDLVRAILDRHLLREAHARVQQPWETAMTTSIRYARRNPARAGLTAVTLGLAAALPFTLFSAQPVRAQDIELDVNLLIESRSGGDASTWRSQTVVEADYDKPIVYSFPPSEEVKPGEPQYQVTVVAIPVAEDKGAGDVVLSFTIDRIIDGAQETLSSAKLRAKTGKDVRAEIKDIAPLKGHKARRVDLRVTPRTL